MPDVSSPYPDLREALDIASDWERKPLASDPYGTTFVARVLRDLEGQLKAASQWHDEVCDCGAFHEHLGSNQQNAK